jgi:hypothetical protein
MHVCMYVCEKGSNIVGSMSSKSNIVGSNKLEGQPKPCLTVDASARVIDLILFLYRVPSYATFLLTYCNFIMYEY